MKRNNLEKVQVEIKMLLNFSTKITSAWKMNLKPHRYRLFKIFNNSIPTKCDSRVTC